MGPLDLSFETCKVLFINGTNLLDGSPESVAQREWLGALAAIGMPCEAVGCFFVEDERETDARRWLAKRDWSVEKTLKTQGRTIHHVRQESLSVTLFQGASTKPHGFDAAEKAGFLEVIGDILNERRPDVVVVRADPSLPDLLAEARQRGLPAIAFVPDAVPRDPAPLRNADLVLTCTRFAAEYLREAFALPCVDLPPLVAQQPVQVAANGPGAIAFDGAATLGNGVAVFAQLAEEFVRRRPQVPLLVLGRGTGSVTLKSGAKVRCVSTPELSGVWNSTRGVLAPVVGWEHMPLAALSALRHGVPAIGSNRGAIPELFDRIGMVLPLPGRVTEGLPVLMRADEMAPWIDTVLRLYDDPVFAAEQSQQALAAAACWTPEKLAPRYARFLAGVVARRRQTAVAGPAVSTNGFASHLDRLKEKYPWPAERPTDAAPGQEEGWLSNGTDAVLTEALSPATRLVVELGSWLGLSTRFIADRAPSATVISVDHWRGSPEHVNNDRYRNLLPHLYETFLSRCWNHRHRIVPLRMSTLDGLREVAAHGLQPDVIFVDAEHSYDAVHAEVTLARQLFPNATISGDDYDWSGVHRAVHGYARKHGLVVDRVGWRGWRLLEPWQVADTRRAPPLRTHAVVMVPHLNGIEWECEQALRQLESFGVRVVRRGGCSAIDVARNEMLSDALHDGADALMFIDSDIGFEPADVLRLLARPEPVVAGVYPKKGMRELASQFAPGVKNVLFGPGAPGPYPLRYAATGFLRIKADVLRRLINELNLPLCNTHWGRGIWPFFMPMIVPHGKDKLHYLGEDWAFSYRLAQIGMVPLADTAIRLWHWGRYSFGWEDAGSTVNRYRSYNYQLTGG
jgi:hypothetical protein